MICVIGEALIDLVEDPDTRTYRAHPGGSPFNVAVGLARLGRHSVLQARLSSDAFGRQLRAHAEANGVDLSYAVDATEPTTLAIVGLDEHRNATYDFYLNGTADWQWTGAELAAVLPTGGITWVHTGSLASWTEPGAQIIGRHLEVLSERLEAGPGDQPGCVISYDPNIRPLLMGDHAVAVATVERSVGRAHVVKASAEDLAWLYPGVPITDVLLSWQRLGPSLVVATDGGAGAWAVSGSGPAGQVDSEGAGQDSVYVAAKPITVVDTVGAGDAFMAGLINALSRVGVGAACSDLTSLSAVLDEAATVAALTCQRAGANPPTAAELEAALQSV